MTVEDARWALGVALAALLCAALAPAGALAWLMEKWRTRDWG